MASVAPPETAALRALRVWWWAARPRTLLAGAAPVLVGTAVAAAEAGGGVRALPALAALAGALLLQVASNFANDVYDHERGADTVERLGPPRATQLGLLSPHAMKLGMLAALVGAAAVGLYLIAVAGWPVLIVGLLAMLAAWAYTGGPWPLGYHGLGDLAVFLFFGVVGVTGSAYVQSVSLSVAALAASIPVGALATAILVVNNLRDIETDARAGKRTLAVRWGRRGARLEYTLLLALAFVVPVLLWIDGVAPWSVCLSLLAAPLTVPLLRSVWTSKSGPRLNLTLAGTARLLAVHALLLAVGWLL